MKKVLIIIGAYLPGFKAGGPVRSVSNLTAGLKSDDYSFYVLTLDHDFKDKARYDVPLNEWVPVGNSQVWYTHRLSLRRTRQVILDLRPDILYLNNFFSRWSINVLFLRWLGLLPPAAVVLATRGEFSPGALALKKTKKTAYLWLMTFWGLYHRLLWHASAEREKEEIERVMARFPVGVERSSRARSAIHVAAPIQVASDLPDRFDGSPSAGVLRKEKGRASFFFVSRVSAKKNVTGAIEMLLGLKGDVTFDICGPAEDTAYLAECQRLMAIAPPNIKINYIGTIPHEQVKEKFSGYHFFLFPTLGENFGHVIVESLSAGCPVVLSDQTPWLGLEQKGVGWDLPLANKQDWQRVLQECVDMDHDRYSRMSVAARDYFDQWAHTGNMRQENIDLLERSLTLNSARPSEQSMNEQMVNLNDR
jgi:glycosyltransferase involved in cell wall biosynthesis